MWSLAGYSDEFNVSSRLYFKLELEPSREALLHFFEQIRKAFPQMNHLRRRDDGGLMLEEYEEDDDHSRYVRLEPSTLRVGYHNPPSGEAVRELAGLVLSQAPYDLSLSDLDYDYLEVLMAFDLEFRGNHDELVAETLLGDAPLVSLIAGAGQRVIDCQPLIGVTLSDDCGTQAYVEIKSRTSTYAVRTGDYEPSMLSTYVTVRRYWEVSGPADLLAAHHDLLQKAEQLATERVVPNVVQPLAAAIASRR